MVWGRGRGGEEWELRRGREEEGDDGGLLSSTESEGLGGICGGCKGNDDNGMVGDGKMCENARGPGEGGDEPRGRMTTRKFKQRSNLIAPCPDNPFASIS